MNKNINGNTDTTKEVERTVKRAKELGSMYELNLTSRTRVCLRGLNAGEVVRLGRAIGLSYEEDPDGLENKPKWQQDLFFALDEAGFIRHGMLKTSKIIKLLCAIVHAKNNFLADNTNYETFEKISDERFEYLVKTVKKVLTDREYKVINYSFALECEEPLDMRRIGEIFHISRERAREVYDKALRKLRYSGEIPEMYGIKPRRKKY